MWGQGTSWHLRATFWQLRAKRRAHLLVPVHSNRLGGLAAACSHIPSLEADGVTCGQQQARRRALSSTSRYPTFFYCWRLFSDGLFFVQRRHARVNALG